MKKCKVGVCGNFDSSTNNVNGQSQKTINIYNKLVEKYGENRVCCVNTEMFRKNPVKALVTYIKLLKNSENIILLPAQSALKVVVPIAVKLKKKYGYKVYYSVIGAWLGKYLENNSKMLANIKELDGVFPETQSLLNILQDLGLNNLELMANFKNLTPICEDEIIKTFEKPYKICFYSRVIPQKGIEELIEAVKEINKDETKFVLDIYGPVPEHYKEVFFEIIKGLKNINYKGVIPSNAGKDILKQYFLQVFPTKFITEGIPGSIVDSYMWGVPVIAAHWISCLDIIDDNITGLVYEFDSFEGLKEKLTMAYNNPEKIAKMRINCVKKASMYTADEVMQKLYSRIEEGAL